MNNFDSQLIILLLQTSLQLSWHPLILFMIYTQNMLVHIRLVAKQKHAKACIKHRLCDRLQWLTLLRCFPRFILQKLNKLGKQLIWLKRLAHIIGYARYSAFFINSRNGIGRHGHDRNLSIFPPD
ncbi:hypothetical protein D3C79_896780 [compost metagenome]